MSGFLHQLAARTLGLGPQARPRAALPYASPAADLAGALADESQAPEAATLNNVASSASAAEGRENARQQAVLPAPLVAEERHLGASPLPRPPSIHTAQPADDALPGRAAAQPSWGADPAGIAETIPPLVASSATRPSESLATPAARISTNTPDATPETGADQANMAQRRFADLENLVSQLLGPAREVAQDSPNPARQTPLDAPPKRGNTVAGVPSIRTQASRERPANARRDSEAEAAPEVRITIGRLEVNPPPRPAPPAPRPSGPAPLSLSDYLARRNGGRP